ncbi:META domain-containing protein [Pseudactinotalea sp. HY160]|uniref:META domain-containing protein n=1 Tax=Pseudactinotalea sp. HY160 TaxID=2654490 RepID=UPI00128B5677|nr:META domain-containing protein [Pseudactinotalea sp. HY160]MPV48466.1 META domain-containing protein [Pseudactinotalea sp. HY160]
MLFLRRAAIVTTAALTLGGVVFALWLGPLSSGGSGAEGDGATPAPGVDVAGRWGGDGDRAPHLIFGAHGEVSGNDGCNGLSGSYTATGDGEVDFHDVLGTLKACPGVDTWLHRLASAVVDGDELAVFDAAGEEIGRLPRA